MSGGTETASPGRTRPELGNPPETERHREGQEPKVEEPGGGNGRWNKR